MALLIAGIDGLTEQRLAHGEIGFKVAAWMLIDDEMVVEMVVVVKWIFEMERRSRAGLTAQKLKKNPSEGGGGHGIQGRMKVVAGNSKSKTCKVKKRN
jgi:hypothetical protein